MSGGLGMRGVSDDADVWVSCVRVSGCMCPVVGDVIQYVVLTYVHMK